MRLVSFLNDGRASWGAVRGDGVVDLGRRLADIGSVQALVEGGEGAMARARAALEGAAADAPLASVRLLMPIPAPRKVFCIGVNYANRNAEYKDGSELPEYPSLFIRVADSFVAHGEPLLVPPESRQLDYEGEIAIVIGKGGRRIAEAEAESHIAGLTCCNEGTMRDWTRHGKFNVTQGKTWEASGAIGPWLVTADEFKGFDNVQVTTRVNGEKRQDDNTSNLMFPFRSLIRYISTWTALKPGDVIVTGTPVGAGIRFTPPKFLRPGDVVEVEVSGVGTLSNTVADES